MSTQTSTDLTAAKKVKVDDELAKAEAEANAAAAKGEETSSSESAPEDKTQTTEGKPEAGEDKGENGNVDYSQLSEKAQKRFKELADENKKLKEQLGSGKPEDQTVVPEGPSIPDILSGKTGEGKLPWDTSSKTDEEETRELTEEELNKRINETVDKKIQEREEAREILNQLHDDTVTIENKYPEFRTPTDDNPNPDFDPDLVKDVSKWFKTMFPTNRKLRLIEFVDRIMGLRKKGTEQGKAQVTETLAKQAAEQAVEPSGTPSSKGQDLESLIRAAKTPQELDELEKRLPHA